jgi:hypothetical protein
MQPAQENMTQAELARHMGVSRAAVSQWKKKDILRDDAFTQPGKKGKVVVAVAVEQVRSNRDIGQALGNGIETGASTDAAPAAEVPEDIPAEEIQPDLPGADVEPVPVEPVADLPAKPNVDSVEAKMKLGRLEEQLRRNRNQALDEALRQGELVLVGDVRKQMARVASATVQHFVGAVPDFSAKIAAKFKIPQRDIQHFLTDEFNAVRALASQKEKERADAAQIGKAGTA